MTLCGFELREAVGRTIDPVGVTPSASPLRAAIGRTAPAFHKRRSDRYILSVRDDVPHARLYRHLHRSRYGDSPLLETVLSAAQVSADVVRRHETVAQTSS